jgi:diguanylate cyclase (GGDEF)-like protein
MNLIGRINRPFWVTGGIILLAGVGVLDTLTGYELSFSLFYVIPIVMLAVVTNGKTGIAISLISAGIWLAADILAGANYSTPLIYAWNSIVRLVFFLLVVLLVNLGKDLEREKILSRTDFLTGAVNNRFFYDLAQREIDRAIRYPHPLTIAFIDVDNFKAINDRFGHSTGDKVLEAIASGMQKHLRKTDVVARVGGDEFAVLLPEVGTEDVRKFIAKMRRILLDEMQNHKWVVTFSIGVLTFNTPPVSVDAMLTLVDREMYTVKNGGKNNISFATYSDQGILESNMHSIEEKKI